MNKIILFLLILTLPLFAQQMNYTFGQKTTGVSWNETGKAITSGATDVVQIVIDFEDFAPGVLTDDQYGVIWFHIDANSATDSTNYSISFFNGAFIYDDGDNDRVETGAIEFSSDSTIIAASSSQADDVTWTAAEITVSGQIVPPEFGLIEIEWEEGTDDSLTVQWTVGYPAVYQREQQHRTRSSGAKPRKAKDTLH